MKIFKNFKNRSLMLVFLLGVIMNLFYIGTTQADSADFLYIGDRGDNTIKRFDAKTGKFLGSFVTTGSAGLLGPSGLIFSSSSLIVANQNVNTDYSGEILKYSGKDGSFLEAIVSCNPPNNRPCDAEAPYAPRGMIRGLGRALYVADWGDFGSTHPGRVTLYDQKSSEFLGDFDSSDFEEQFNPRGIVLGPDGLVYVSVTGNLDQGETLPGYILRFNPHTLKFVDVFSSYLGAGCAADLHRPEGLTFGPDGNLYAIAFRADENDTDKVLILNGSTGQCIDKIDLDVAREARAFGQALLFGPEGHLFIPITNTGEVRRYNVSTKTYDVFLPSANNGGPLLSPFYLTFRNTNPKTLGYSN